MIGAEHAYFLQLNEKGGSFLLGIGALLLACAFFIITWWTGQIGALRFLFPVLMTAIGLLLFLTDSSRYLGFMWWMWLLAPLVRRIVDWQAGWVDPNPILLTPFLVTAISGLTLLNHVRQLFSHEFFPFLIGIIGILCGYLVGMVQVSMFAATFSMLQWVTPLIIAFHIVATWDLYPRYREVVLSTFYWGLVLLGVYGVVQFRVLLPWDAFWMVESGMESIGRPEPGQVRVFSVLNSPGPLAHVTLAGLLLLFHRIRLGALLAAVPGYFVFLLSLVRSAWGAWVIGLSYLILMAQGRMRARLLVFLLLGVLIGVPLVLQSEDLGTISSRVETFTNLEEDLSLRARLATYRGITLRIINAPLGYGLGTTGTSQKVVAGKTRALDSGLLDIPLTLGWIGSACYLFALFRLFYVAYRTQGLAVEPFRTVCRAIVWSLLILLLFASTNTGVSGTVLWMFLGLSIASVRYQQAQMESEAEQADAHAAADTLGGA